MGFSATHLLDLAITECMVDIHLSCIIWGGVLAKGASLALETISGVSVRNDGLIYISLTPFHVNSHLSVL